MDTLGARLKHVRGSRSQREFAEMLGVATSTYQLYEGDKRLPDSDALAKIAAEGWPGSWLLTGTGAGYKIAHPVSANSVEEPTRHYGVATPIDPETWDRAKRIVLLAMDPLVRKPSAVLFAEAVAEVYNEIVGRPHDNDSLPALLQIATGRLSGLEGSHSEVPR